MPFDPSSYGDAAAALLTPRLAELGPGQPNRSARPLLDRLTPETLFDGHPIHDAEMAACCLAALWLYHDFLDESHALSQEIETPTGSYWHAILHRREPDPSNAKYWFRRAGPHPVLTLLREQAPALGFDYQSPQSFVDFVERVRATGTPEEEVAKQVQNLEWQLLFAWCWVKAVG